MNLSFTLFTLKNMSPKQLGQFMYEWSLSVKTFFFLLTIIAP